MQLDGGGFLRRYGAVIVAMIAWGLIGAVTVLGLRLVFR